MILNKKKNIYEMFQIKTWIIAAWIIVLLLFIILIVKNSFKKKLIAKSIDICCIAVI